MNSKYMYYMDMISYLFFSAMCANSAVRDYISLTEQELSDLDLSFFCGGEL